MKNNQTEHLPDGGKMMTAVDILWDEIKDYKFNSEKARKIAQSYYKANELRMQELKHAYEAEQNNSRGIFRYESFEHYYQENYGR